MIDLPATHRRNPGDDQRATDHLRGREALVQQQPGEDDGQQRPEHADQRHLPAADAANRGGLGEHRQHGAEQAHRGAQRIHRPGLHQRRQWLRRQKVAAGGGRRRQHHQRGAAGSAEFRDHADAAGKVQRIADRRGEHQAAAEPHHRRVAGDLQVVGEGRRNAGVAQRQRQDLAAGDGAVVQHHAEQQRQRRVGEQDQPFQAGGNVLETIEVQDAGAIV